MGQRRLATPQKDDAKKRPQSKKSNNAVLNSTTTRKGEVFRAQRRTSENVNLRAARDQYPSEQISLQWLWWRAI